MPTFDCSMCSQKFSRQEHLTRHKRIHTREKPYQCRLCQKSFSRLDVLNRHTASHEEQTEVSATMASTRACKPCATNRARCSRGQPCRRCRQRSLACEYPTSQRTDQLGSIDVIAASFNTQTSPAGNAMSWVDDFGQFVWGVSDTNWISPDHPDTVDLDALLVNFASADQTGIQQPSPQPLQAGVLNENRYYVDGPGSRVPFGGRAHHRGSVVTTHESNESVSPSSSQSPDLSCLCPATAYDRLIQALLAENQIQCLDVDFDQFPTQRQIQLYSACYFDNFNVVFPFLRKASFATEAMAEWRLLLAVAAVGSRYMRRSQGIEPGETLLRLLSVILRRHTYGYAFDNGRDESAVHVPGQQLKSRTCPSLPVLQAGIINIACMLHSGKAFMIERAFTERHYLLEACHALQLLSTPHDSFSTVETWAVREGAIRTGMMIWFLDSMFLYEFDAKPMISLSEIKATLPSHDDLWENPELIEHGKRAGSSLSLSDAIEMIYIEKKLPSGLGEFSIGLLINAVYRNTKDILAREQRRLNSWTPTAFAQQPFAELPAQDTWLPNTAVTSKWRNSACDCLDVLHWRANSKIAQLAGSEHHTILHLHLSRLIILTPTTLIQTFATGLVAMQGQPPDSQTRTWLSARYQVLQWAVHDQFKARLAIIHCGALYWHIRRHSCDSLLEPYAIYMATLVLWAYCTCMQLPEVLEATAQGPKEDPDPSFLHLDRPLDDEICQMFIRLGHNMSGFISNVGNIHDKASSGRILQEGIALLGEPCYTWGAEESYVKLLYDLRMSLDNMT